MLNDAQKSEAKSAIQQIEELLKSGELQNNGEHAKSIFKDAVIALNDLLMKCSLYLQDRVDFTDDVTIDSQNQISDVTELVRFFRNGIGHIDGVNRKLDDGSSSLNIFVGLKLKLQLADNDIELKYHDDTAYNMGKHVMYLKRHFIRAFEEAKTKLKPYL
ncbi:hypothetical protein [Chryseobacterium sp.]|uniref:hypothetical protein n=1 Tax=Chryseobacterium sp. TaxID=1871047 RepID=UPI0031D14A17